jgi:hypothetical protein
VTSPAVLAGQHAHARGDLSRPGGSSAEGIAYPSDGEAAEASDGQRIKRQQSAIPFPYILLSDVVTLAQAVQKHGHVCRIEEVAADLDQQTSSGASRSRLSAARMFGTTTGFRQFSMPPEQFSR